MGLFTENLLLKFLFPLLTQTGLVVSLEEHYYKKCYVLNLLSIPNSKDSVQNLKILSFQENSLEDSTSKTERHTELNWKNQINIKNKLLH